LKIHWQVEDEEGVLPLRGGRAWVLYADGLLDRLSRAPGAEEDGFAAAAEGGKVELSASGRLAFVVDGKRGRKVLLPSGGSIDFEVGEESGSLRLSGGEAAADPLVGKQVAGYKLLGRLGSGAVGVVYRALQTSLDREVALKILNAEASKDPDKVASFRREAIAAGRLSHPNLVQVHDVGDEGELHFYSMELVPGGTLEERLKEAGPMSWREAVTAVRDAALALAFAESHHLVHRDVKPENLMFTASGHVKLADLGLAATRGMIDREAAGGTPHFMAPESIHPDGVDHRADLYSLGCTLFRLATGDTVFHGDSVRDILRAHRELDPPSFREAEVHAPREAEELLQALLQKDPEDRPESASAVAEMCDRVLAHQKQRRGLGLLTLLVLASAGTVAVLQSMKEEPAPEPVAPVEGPDPEAERLEAERLLEQRIQRDFTAAMALGDPEGKARELAAFVAAHPDHGLADTARSALQQLEAEAARDADPALAEPDEQGPSPAVVALQAELAPLLEAGRSGAALARIDAAPELVLESLPMRDQIVEQAERQLRSWEDEHAGLLDAQDWPAAATLRDRFGAAIEEATGAEGRAWPGRLLALADADNARQAEAADQAFREARLQLVTTLQQELPPACAALDAAAAADAFRLALEACPHDGLRQLGGGSAALLDAAARAEAALREHLRAMGSLNIKEAQDGKRAELLTLGSDGLRLRVQVRGERVERLDPWELYLSSAALPLLLDEALPEDTDPADLAALQLLIAGHNAGLRLRQLGDQLPSPEEARLWAEDLDRAVALVRPVAPPPAWLEGERQALLHLAGFARALGAQDDYSALLRFEDFLGSFSLAAALGSGGATDWGLER